MAVAQLPGALHALLQQSAGNVHFVAPVELAVTERPIHGFVVNLDIRQQFSGRGGAERSDLPGQCIRPGAQFGASAVGHDDSRRRNAGFPWLCACRYRRKGEHNQDSKSEMSRASHDAIMTVGRRSGNLADLNGVSASAPW